GAHLILRAHRLVDQILLDMDCIGRQCLLIAHPVLEGVKGEQETHREGGARTKARPGWEIGNVMYLEPFADTQEPQTFADRWVFDQIVPPDVFDLRIRDAAVVFEEWRQPAACDIAALVDGSRQYRPTIFVVPNRIVGASSEEGDTERCARNDH